MKSNYIIALSFVLILLSSCKEKINNEYTISGKIDNYKNNVVILLKERVDSLTIFSQDTISINSSGEFSFTEKIDTLTIGSLVLGDSFVSYQFLINKNENIHINGDYNNINQLQIRGNKVNDQLSEFNKQIQTDLEDIANSKKTITELQIDSLDNTKYITEFKNKEFELSNKITEYIKENPSNEASVLIINRFFKNETSLDRLSEALKKLKGKALDFALSDYLMDFEITLKSFSKGATAPLITDSDIYDKEFRLSEQRNTYIVLTFVSFDSDQFEDVYKSIEKEVNKLKPGKNIKTTRNNKTFDEKVNYNVKFVIVVKDTHKNTVFPKKLNKDITIIAVDNGWSNQIFVDYNVTQTPMFFLINTYGRIEERNFELNKIQSSLDNLPRGLKEITKK